MSLIGHIEIAGKNGQELETFYSNLLDWKILRRDIGGFAYGDVQTEKGPTIGIRHEPEGKAEIVLYVEVGDLKQSVARAEELGSTVRIAPRDGGNVLFALIEDPQGNPLGLTQKKTSK